MYSRHNSAHFILRVTNKCNYKNSPTNAMFTNYTSLFTKEMADKINKKLSYC